MKNLKYILIVVFCSFLLSCEKDEYEIMTLTVAAQKVEYNPAPFGDVTLMGYSVTDSADNQQFVIGHIQGFDDQYEEGYIYVIKIKRVERTYKNKKPFEDQLGGSIYYLIKIISKEKEPS